MRALADFTRMEASKSIDLQKVLVNAEMRTEGHIAYWRQWTCVRDMKQSVMAKTMDDEQM